MDSLKKENWSSLRKWPVSRRENGHYRGANFNKSHVTEVVSLRRENGHVTEVDSLMQGEWLCYGGGQFNGGSNGHVRGGQVN